MLAIVANRYYLNQRNVFVFVELIINADLAVQEAAPNAGALQYGSASEWNLL